MGADTAPERNAKTMTITLNDERFGDKQTFATIEEMDSEIEKCAREWYRYH